MRVSRTILFLAGVIHGLAGCAPAPALQTLVQSAFADTHLSWRSAPENQLAYSVATASGIARVELRALPGELDTLTLDLPGMRRVEEVQWQGEDGGYSMLYDGAGGPQGVSLESRGHGFRLSISGEALDLMRGGGVLTVVDFYRG